FISTRILRDRGAGPTIIVSPLLALMRNQIEAAERLGIRAVTINSTNRDDWDRATQKVLADQVDAILISPERLSNEEFVDNVLQPVAERIGLLVVDEAHCISDWGHDFRPDYRRLVNILRQMPPNMPLLGTTATANNRVIADVQSQLGDIQIQRGTLVRESLSLQTLRLPDQASRLAWLASHIPELPGTGIVYVLTIRDAEQVANWLSSQG
ncbi:DEAD/DEAH box helicase, partial [Thiolapillus sp.]